MTEAEKYLEENYGITFTKGKDGFYNEIATKWLNSLESYKDQCINSISDEMIKELEKLQSEMLDNYKFHKNQGNKYNLETFFNGARYAYRRSKKLVKQKLLNK